MGRYLANGIPTRISVFLKKGKKIDENDLIKIKNDLLNYVDLSMYELNEYEDGYAFHLKTEVFNKNIYELIKEINELTPCYSYFIFNLFDDCDINVLSDEFNKDNYKIELIKSSNNLEYFVQNTNSNNSIGETLSYPYQFWVLTSEIEDKYYVDMKFIMLWTDFSKFNGEDETEMLRILNNMKSSYYKNPLSKSLIYFIAG